MIPGDQVLVAPPIPGEVLNKLGMEFGKNKDLVMWFLRLTQKQEDVRGMLVELDRLEREGHINPTLASVTRIRMSMHQGQDLLLAAFSPGALKRQMAMDSGNYNLAVWNSPPDESYNPVIIAMDKALRQHQDALLSRAGKDEFNTMKNCFDLFNRSKVEQTVETRQAPLAAPEKKKAWWKPW